MVTTAAINLVRVVACHARVSYIMNYLEYPTATQGNFKRTTPTRMIRRGPRDRNDIIQQPLVIASHQRFRRQLRDRGSGIFLMAYFF